VIDLALELPAVEDGIRVGAPAVIGGELDHRSQAPAVVEPGARIDRGVRHEAWRAQGPPLRLPDAGGDSFFATDSGGAVERLAVLLGLGLVLAVAVPGWLRRRSREVRAAPAGLLGWGIGALAFGALASFATGVLFLVLLAVGIATGAGGLAWTAFAAGSLLQMALFALFGIALFYVAPVLASAGLGGALLARFRPEDGGNATVVDAVLTVAVGATAYTLLRAIPWFGWLAALGAALVGLGALALWLRQLFVESEPV
jgi:hypothetical protein